MDPLAGLDLDACLRASAGGSALSALVQKLNSCFSQLEQFQVKVHELPAASGSSRAAPTSAIRFFNTHQLKVSVQVFIRLLVACCSNWGNLIYSYTFY